MLELKEHNIVLYERFRKLIAENNRCAIVSATGTGKSYIAGKYIEDNNLQDQTLIVVPSTAIQASWLRMFKDINIITYTSLLNSEKWQDLSEIKLIICDEFHHLGAKKWGKAFKEFTDRYTNQLVGLSATPIRYLDDGRDMTREVFEDSVVYGYDLADAIDKSILPSFKYITSIYDLPTKINNIKNNNNFNLDTTRKLVSKLDIAASKYSIANILTENFENKTTHKVIVFVNKIKEIDGIAGMFQNVFPEWESYVVHSKMPKDKIFSAIDGFEQCENSAFIFAVDIFNEGIHVKNVDGLVLFRKTVSPTVYLQQLGRGLTSNNVDKRITIIDFVANYSNLISYKSASSSLLSINKHIKKEERQIILYDYAMEQGVVLNELSSLLNLKQWTEEEIQIIKDNYVPGMGVSHFIHLLPGRTRTSILTKAKRMHLTSGWGYGWSDEDIEYIKSNYTSIEDIKQIKEKFSNKTEPVIILILAKLGLLKNSAWFLSNWTCEEEKNLRDNYKTLSVRELQSLLNNRSQKEIYFKARTLGLITSNPNKNKWTNNEIHLLKTNYGKCNLEELCQILPRHTSRSIMHKITQLNLTQLNRVYERKQTTQNLLWTEEEKIVLVNNYKTCTFDELQNLLPNRSINAIKQMASKLGLCKQKRTRKMHYWNEKEDEKLMHLLNSSCTMNEIMKSFPNRTPDSVKGRIYKIRHGHY